MYLLANDGSDLICAGHFLRLHRGVDHIPSMHLPCNDLPCRQQKPLQKSGRLMCFQECGCFYLASASCPGQLQVMIIPGRRKLDMYYVCASVPCLLVLGFDRSWNPKGRCQGAVRDAGKVPAVAKARRSLTGDEGPWDSLRLVRHLPSEIMGFISFRVCFDGWLLPVPIAPFDCAPLSGRATNAHELCMFRDSSYIFILMHV